MTFEDWFDGCGGEVSGLGEVWDAAKADAEESLCRDALRYRKLRDLAVRRSRLEEMVALSALDHVRTDERFDREVDDYIEPKAAS